MALSGCFQVAPNCSKSFSILCLRNSLYCVISSEWWWWCDNNLFLGVFVKMGVRGPPNIQALACNPFIQRQTSRHGNFITHCKLKYVSRIEASLHSVYGWEALAAVQWIEIAPHRRRCEGAFTYSHQPVIPHQSPFFQRQMQRKRPPFPIHYSAHCQQVV